MPRFNSVKPGMFGSLANPEIDAVSKGCFNDPVDIILHQMSLRKHDYYNNAPCDVIYS